MIARVRGLMRPDTAAASMLKVSGSMSTKTGRAPSRAMTPAVAKNEYAEVMTSSPGPISSAMSDASNASVPDETPMAKRAPVWAATSFSSSSTSGPRMNRCDEQTLRTASWISSWMVSY